MDVERLPEIKEALICYLQGRPEIIFAMLYGSAAEGRAFRDLDIGLFVDRELIPVGMELAYAFDLAEELKTIVACPVDVRVINNAPLPFRYNVSRGTPLIVQDAEIFSHFLERTWDMFLDFQPLALQYLKELR
jgi:predicted nucleotidyltransferase